MRFLKLQKCVWGVSFRVASEVGKSPTAVLLSKGDLMVFAVAGTCDAFNLLFIEKISYLCLRF